MRFGLNDWDGVAASIRSHRSFLSLLRLSGVRRSINVIHSTGKWRWKPYRFRYHKAREYRLHSAATGLLYARPLDAGIFDWLSGYPDLWSALLYVLAGQYEHAGTLGELVMQAEQASVAQALGGDPAKALTAPAMRSNASSSTDCATCSRKSSS